ncbi:MAG: hypothetical protein SV775_12525, partial [Thermodesulfobacteriota bacterium]|nr:hypothetical protein [Thermodesulfobacteriota bacterium]
MSSHPDPVIKPIAGLSVSTSLVFVLGYRIALILSREIFVRVRLSLARRRSSQKVRVYPVIKRPKWLFCLS